MVAHIIREPSKSFAKSICALQADRRWAVTGTPIQNRLADLFSLFKFLRCSPFDDQKIFNTQVAQNWKKRSDPDSVAKLKTLVNCLALRRPKTTIELLPRRDETVFLDFSMKESEDYQRVKNQTLHNLEKVGGESGGAQFLNTLKWVNELRLMCIHGMRDTKKTQKIEKAPPVWSVQKAQACFDQLDGVGLAKCSNATCCQDLSSALSSEMDAEHEDDPWIGETLELWCSLCFKSPSKIDTKVFKICNHLPRRGQKQDSAEEEGDSESSVVFASTNDNPLPTKVRRLLQDLMEGPADIKRFVSTLIGYLKLAKVSNPALCSPHGPKRSTSFSPNFIRILSVVSVSTVRSPPPNVPTSSAPFAPIRVSGCSWLPYPAAVSGLI